MLQCFSRTLVFHLKSYGSKSYLLVISPFQLANVCAFQYWSSSMPFSTNKCSIIWKYLRKARVKKNIFSTNPNYILGQTYQHFTISRDNFYDIIVMHSLIHITWNCVWWTQMHPLWRGKVTAYPTWIWLGTNCGQSESATYFISINLINMKPVQCSRNWRGCDSTTCLFLLEVLIMKQTKNC